MDNLKEMLKNSISSIEKTTELLYQQKKVEGYQLLNKTIEILIGLVKEISKRKEKNQVIPIDETELVNVLSDAVKALQEKDEVLLSDILEYELKEILQGLTIVLD